MPKLIILVNLYLFFIWQAFGGPGFSGGSASVRFNDTNFGYHFYHPNDWKIEQTPFLVTVFEPETTRSKASQFSIEVLYDVLREGQSQAEKLKALQAYIEQSDNFNEWESFELNTMHGFRKFIDSSSSNQKRELRYLVWKDLILATEVQTKKAEASDASDIWIVANSLNLDELLFDSIELGNFSDFQKALKKGANPNAIRNDGYTPLNLAIRYQRTQMVATLLKLGVNFQKPNNKGETALMLAAEWGDLKLVKMFVERGADVNAQNNHWHSVITYALKSSNRTAIIKYLILNGAKASQSVYFHGQHYSSLFHIWNRFHENLWLAENMHDVKRIDLHDFIQNMRNGLSDETLQVFTTLLKRGASVNKRNREKENVLAAAIKLYIRRLIINRDEEATQFALLKNSILLILNQAKETEVELTAFAYFTKKLASLNNCLEENDLVEAFLKAGATANAPSKKEESAYINLFARKQNNRGEWQEDKNPDCIITALNSMAKYNINWNETYENMNALHYIIGSELDISLVEYLIKKKIDLNHYYIDSYYDETRTPLLLALIRKNIKVAALLVNSDADPSIGPTLAYLLEQEDTEGNFSELAQKMISNGADVELRGGQHNYTPIYYAGTNLHIDSLELLLQKVEKLTDIRDMTRLLSSADLIEETQLRRILYTMVQKGLDVNSSPSPYSTLQTAIKKNHYPSVKILMELGADPVQQSKSLLMNAVNYYRGRISSEILRVLVKYKELTSYIDQKNGQNALQTILNSIHFRERTKDIESVIYHTENLNHRDKKGMTALMYALQSQQWDIARLLLERGADPNQIANKPRGRREILDGPAIILLTYALQSNHLDEEERNRRIDFVKSFLSLLFEHGLDPDLIYGKAETSWNFNNILLARIDYWYDDDWFRENYNPKLLELVKLFYQNNANPTPEVKTAIHRHKFEFIQFVRESSPNSIQANIYKSLLLKLSYHKPQEERKILLDYAIAHIQAGIDPNMTIENRTSLNFSIKEDLAELALVLIDAGADVSNRCRDGYNTKICYGPAFLAIEESQYEVFDKIVSKLDHFPKSLIYKALQAEKIDPLISLHQRDINIIVDNQILNKTINNANASEAWSFLFEIGLDPKDEEWKHTVGNVITNGKATTDRKIQLLSLLDTQGVAFTKPHMLIAAKYSTPAIVQYLIDKGVEFDFTIEQNRRLKSPLYKAITNKNHDVASLLIDLGADPNRDLQIQPLLFITNNAEIAIQLIRAGAILQQTIANGHLLDFLAESVTKAFIEKKTDFYSVVREVLQYDVDVNLEQIDNHHYRYSTYSWEHVLFRGLPEENPRLQSQILEILSLYIEKGADFSKFIPYAEEEPGNIGLHLVEIMNDEEVATDFAFEIFRHLFASEYYDPDFIGSSGKPNTKLIARLLANRSKSAGAKEKVARYMLDLDPKYAKQKDRYGTPVSFYAAYHFQTYSGLLQLFIDKGARIEERNYYGFTMLNYAAAHNPEAAHFLIEQGARINSQNLDRQAALSTAVIAYEKKSNEARKPYFLELIKTLIEKGADKKSKDIHQKRAYDYARDWNLQRLLR